jgi:putative aldouronate transport system substrate-binding protein
MFRAPHTWRQNPDSTLTHAIETPEYKQAIECMKRLNDAGVYHPDAQSMSIQQAKDNFLGGRFAGYMDGWTAIITHRMNFRQLDPSNSAAVILVPPGYDGGNPAVERSQGFFGMTCIPTNVGKDTERLKELLRIVDYAQAPFGSEEYTFLRWGVEGVHYDLQNGAPTASITAAARASTKRGTTAGQRHLTESGGCLRRGHDCFRVQGTVVNSEYRPARTAAL